MAPDQANAPHIIPNDGGANNIICFAALAEKQAGTMYTDAIGALPTISLDDHQYYFIAYDYDSNYIFAEPIKDVKDATLVEAFQKVFQTLEERGMKPTLNITDNQAVKPINRYGAMVAYMRPHFNKLHCRLCIAREFGS